MTAGLVALIDALNVRTALQKDRLKTSKWMRHHASTKRDLPNDYNDDLEDQSSLVGVLLNEIATRQEVSSHRSGSVSGSVDAPTSPQSPSNNQPQSPPANRPDSASERRQIEGTATLDGGRTGDEQIAASSQQVDARTSHSTAPGSGQNNSGSAGTSNPIADWKRWLVLAGLLSGAGAGLGGGSAIINHYLDGDKSTVIEQPEQPIEMPDYEYPLLDWLEENRHHLER